MRTIPHEAFPPSGALVIERDERRIVLLHVDGSKISLAVWLRRIESVDPTVLGGWYCTPDAGLSLTRESARELFSALAEVLGCVFTLTSGKPEK